MWYNSENEIDSRLQKIVTVLTSCNTAISYAAALSEPFPSTDDSLQESSYSQGTVVDVNREGAITQASTAVSGVGCSIVEKTAIMTPLVFQEMVEDDEGMLSEEETIEPEYQGTLESATGSSKDDDDRAV